MQKAMVDVSLYIPNYPNVKSYVKSYIYIKKLMNAHTPAHTHTYKKQNIGTL